MGICYFPGKGDHMKNLFLLAFLLAMAATLGAVTYTWVGGTGTNWSTHGNWNPVGVPGASDDAIIPNVTNDPVINTDAYCRDVTIQAGARLTLNTPTMLQVFRDAICYGQIVFTDGSIYVSNNFFWESGSTVSIPTANGFLIRVGRNMQFSAGSNVQLTDGLIVFYGPTVGELANYSTLTQLNNVSIGKDVASSLSIRTLGQPFTVIGNISLSSGVNFFNYSSAALTLKGNLIDQNPGPAGYGLKWDSGTLIMDGTDQIIDLNNNGSYLNNLTLNQSGTIDNSSNLTLKGTLQINSGILDSGGYTITLAGNWENNAGAAAFTEGTGRVIFNGSAHQYCNNTENFNILEVNKSGGALRINSSAATVTSAQYDWTAGAVDVLAGTFTAENLADAGIYGSFYVNPGAVINLTAVGSVDLMNTSLTFTSGGTINIYGGTSQSTWNNVNLTMSGSASLLDFHDQGIFINGSYPPTYSISGGTIRTSGNFQCSAPFSPGAGTVEMDGPDTRYIYMTAGSLHNLKISKSNPAAIVYPVASLNCTGNINITSGIFSISDETVTCATDVVIYGTLLMNNASGSITSGSTFFWHSGSSADAVAGTIKCGLNWYVYNGSFVQLPTAVITYLQATSAAYIYLADADFRFGITNIGTTSVASNYSILSTSTQDLYIQGSLVITPGSELDLNGRNMTVTGSLYLDGMLDIHATDATVMGTMELDAASTLNIDSGSLTCTSTAIPRDTYSYGTLWVNSGTLNLVNNSLIMMAGSANTLVSGTIYCDGITAQTAGTFEPAGGSIVLGNLYAGGTKAIKVSNGNWVPNLNIDAGSQGYYLDAHLIVKGNLTIVTGSLNAYSSIAGAAYNITISGDWSNQGGTFSPSTGKVTFNGAAHQYVNYSETFNIIESNKSSGAIRVNAADAVVTCAQYDWIAGAIDVLAGTFTANDLVDNGLYGGYYCNTGGTLNLTNSDGRIDINGTLQILGGEVNIFGGTMSSYWGYAANATVTMSGGTLNYKNQGIYVYYSPIRTLTMNITGGTITTVNGFTCNRMDFIPAGGIIEFRGSSDAYINFTATGSSFNKLTINKSYARQQENGLNSQTDPTRSNTVFLSSNVTARGIVLVDNGELNLNGHTLNCGGSLTVRNSSVLALDEDSTVAMAGGTSLVVYSGAQIDVVAAADHPATFTHFGEGYYTFTIRSGGMLSANYVIFEYMDAAGLNMQSGSTTGGLHNCTFRNGAVTGTLFTVNTAQEFTVTGAVFPTSTGLKNVAKTSNQGKVSFYQATGIFAGPVYENDPYGRVFWTGTANDLQLTAVNWSRPDDYVCAPVTAVVTVRNNGANDISTPFRVDLYKNLATAPPAGTLGDLFLEISSLDAGSTKTVTFSNVSTDIPGDWTSWFRVDANNYIAETNESNNLWATPINSAWLPLPAISDLMITRTGLLALDLAWTYPISVNQFVAYRSADPYFTPGPANLWATVTSPIIHTVSNGDKWFYVVKAVRNLP